MTKKSFNKYIPGFVLCFAIAAAAKFISIQFSFSAVVIAILLGFVIGNTTQLRKKFDSGIKKSEKLFLQLSIVLMGLKLDFGILRDLGFEAIIIVVLGMIVTIFSALYFGRLFNLKRELALLVGIGNGVCGNSAIAATKQIVGADEEEVGISVAVINILGTAGMFFVPFLGSVILNFTDLETGVLIGNTLQAVGQVLAASFAVGEVALQTATVIKMARVLMLTPLIFVLIAFIPREKQLSKGERSKIKVPMFIIGFVLFSIIPTFKLLPESIIHTLVVLSGYFLVIAMSAIGLKISFSSIVKNGKSAFFTGLAVFLLQLCFSALMIHFLL